MTAVKFYDTIDKRVEGLSKSSVRDIGASVAAGLIAIVSTYCGTYCFSIGMGLVSFGFGMKAYDNLSF